MKRVMTGAIAVLALAGCGGGKDVSLKNASMEEVAKASAGSAPRFNPGQWESVGEVVSMEFPGMPKDAMSEQVIKQMQGKPITTLRCMTAEEARKPDASVFSGKNQGKCVYDKYEMSGGKISGELTCTGEGAEKMHAVMSGSFSPDKFDVEMEMTSDGPRGAMKMKVKNHSRRVGECPPA